MRSSEGEASSFSSTRFKNERAFYDFVWPVKKEVGESTLRLTRP